MHENFRLIPKEAFGIKSIVRLRDIEAVVHNYNLFKAKAQATGAICAAVLKGDVHGLQMADVAPALYADGARYFFIEDLSEGIELRDLLPQVDAKIYVMAGLLRNEESFFTQYNLTPCLNSLEQIRSWNAWCAKAGTANAVIHLDTHMNRLGLLDDEVELLSNGYSTFTSNITIEFLMSHFFDIKGKDTANCYMQLKVLESYRKKLPPLPVCFACTDSVILLDNSIFNFDMIRPGIGIVGGAPNADHPISPDAKHTIEVFAKFSQVKRIKKGDTIGYGGAFTVKDDLTMALVHIGYKDGYLRSLSETDLAPKGVYMYLAGHRLPIVGKISFGATTVDVTGVPNHLLEKYFYVEVVGPNVDIRRLADIGGCYEILAALGRPNSKVADFTLTQFSNEFGESI